MLKKKVNKKNKYLTPKYILERIIYKYDEEGS